MAGKVVEHVAHLPDVHDVEGEVVEVRRTPTSTSAITWWSELTWNQTPASPSRSESRIPSTSV